MTAQEIREKIKTIIAAWDDQYDIAISCRCNESLARNLAAEHTGHKSIELLKDIYNFLERHEDDLK